MVEFSPSMVSVWLPSVAVGAVVRFAVDEDKTVAMVSLVPVIPAGAVITDPTSAEVNVPAVSVTSGLEVFNVPVTVRSGLRAHALAPLLQNSVTGDGHGYAPVALGVRPLTTAVALPFKLPFETPTWYKAPPVVVPRFPTT